MGNQTAYGESNGYVIEMQDGGLVELHSLDAFSGYYYFPLLLLSGVIIVGKLQQTGLCCQCSRMFVSYSYYGLSGLHVFGGIIRLTAILVS